MNESKEELQQQVSQLLHQDIVQIATFYGENNYVSLPLTTTFIQDIMLLKTYDVKYVHNNELNEIIGILQEELHFNTAVNLSIRTALDFLIGKEEDIKKALYVYLFLRVSKEHFSDAFSIFSVMNATVKDLFSDFMQYIFNNSFLTLDESIQIDCLYKAWNLSLQVFQDNEASQFAYGELKKLFHTALVYEKTEVAFWLYYTPLHYFNSGTHSNKHEANERFKQEIEKPLEKYIEEKVIPKYNIQPNTRKPEKNKKKKVAFVMQRIIRHSTVHVLFNLLKKVLSEKQDNYEFVLYDLAFPESNGSDATYVEEFKLLGIEYVNLHEKIFGNSNQTYSLLEKCIKSREILIEDKVDIFIGLHTRIEYIFFYGTRTAPQQFYWYHGSNEEYDIEGIDKRISHCGISPTCSFEMESFFVLGDYKKSQETGLEQSAKEVRDCFPSDYTILGSVGRLIKIDNDKYLQTVFQIMKKNPKTIYLACGDGDKSRIEEVVRKHSLEERFIFTGFVNPKVYGRVIDVYLNTFPDPGGESVNEFLSLDDNKYVVSLNKE